MKFSKICTGLLAGLAISAASINGHAAAILFAHVDNDGPYVPAGNQLAGMLAGAGHTVTTRFLDAAVYNDYNTFDQIFVYDLYQGPDNEANQVANYQGIANWYNGLSDQNLILDGRIISSTSGWVNPPETAWIQNYRDQLDARGGGLVLGTDHASINQTTGVFVDGINTINTLINVGLFNSFYFTPPLEALVDPNSPLYIAGLAACSSSPADQCINDNSSTSFVATGLQANGQVLTPVAYHGTQSQAFDLAAVSSTIGSITFGTCDDGSQPPCPPTGVPEPATLGLFWLGLAALGLSRRRWFNR